MFNPKGSLQGICSVQLEAINERRHPKIRDKCDCIDWPTWPHLAPC